MPRRPRKPKPPGATAARGYGARHQRERKAAIAAMPDGQPCFRCRRPMHAWQQLQYDHVIAVALGGRNGPKALSHMACNLSHGARLGNRLAKARAAGILPVMPTSRRW